MYILEIAVFTYSTVVSVSYRGKALGKGINPLILPATG